MGSFIKSKRVFRCTKCSRDYLKWQGVCSRGCGLTGTIEEVALIAKKTGPVSEGTAAARKLRRRAKDSERDIAKRMLSVDGADPQFRNIASNTGRVGFITGMRIDAVSRSYVTENKNRKMPTWLVHAWLLINQRAVDFNKHALLHVDPPNMPRNFVIQGRTQPLDTMAIITQARHEELIGNERILEALLREFATNKDYLPLAVLYERLEREIKGKA